MEQIANEAVGKKAGGSRLQKKHGAGSAPLIALGLTAAIMGGAYVGLCAYANSNAAIWKNTYILGQDIGGLTAEQAVQKLEAVLPEMEVGLYFYDSATEHPYSDHSGEPDASVSLADLGAEIDVPALVAGAEQAVKSGPFLTAGWRYLSNMGNTYYGAAANTRTDADKTAKAAGQVASENSWSAVSTSYSVEEDALLVQIPMDGWELDQKTLQERLEPKYWEMDLALDIPYETLPPEKTMTAREIHDAVSGEVKNAGYDPETDSIIPEQVGADFSVAAAQSIMDDAEPGSTVRIPAEIQMPAVTAEELEAVLFRDVLGEARTKLTGTAARTNNVRLAAAAFDGTVLNAGDVFSYNETVGKRTAASGYQMAPAYVQGETVDVIGGGVCQPSSTLYLACLRANLEITERYAHRYVPSYITMGMDATVSWGTLDYKFTNNTAYPIKIAAFIDSGYLTVQLLGTNVDGSYVKMTYETLSSTPFDVVYEDDPTLAPGEEVVKTTPYTGYRVKTYRHVYAADGTLLSSTFEDTSDYKSRNRVILRGPAEASSPVTGPVTEPGSDTPVITIPPDDGFTPVEPPIEDTPTNPVIVLLPEA